MSTEPEERASALEKRLAEAEAQRDRYGDYLDAAFELLTEEQRVAFHEAKERLHG